MSTSGTGAEDITTTEWWEVTSLKRDLAEARSERETYRNAHISVERAWVEAQKRVAELEGVDWKQLLYLFDWYIGAFCGAVQHQGRYNNPCTQDAEAIALLKTARAALGSLTEPKTDSGCKSCAALHKLHEPALRVSGEEEARCDGEYRIGTSLIHSCVKPAGHEGGHQARQQADGSLIIWPTEPERTERCGTCGGTREVRERAGVGSWAGDVYGDVRKPCPACSQGTEAN